MPVIPSYALALFVHVIGVIAIFIGYGIVTFAALAVRRATSVGEVRAILGPVTAGKKIGFETIGVIDVLVAVGVILTGFPGIYLAWQTDNLSADWIGVATGAFLLVAPLGPFVINPRLHEIMTAALGEPDTPVAGALLAGTRSRALIVALSVVSATLFAIVYLMTNKPALPGSLLTVACGLACGLLTGLLAARQSQWDHRAN